MKFTPNLGPITKISYIVIGIALVAGGVFWTTAPAPWVRFVLGVAGILTVIEGAVGY